MQNPGIPHQERRWIGFFKRTERGDGFRCTTSLDVTIRQIERDVVANIPGMGLGAIQRINCFRAVAIQEVSVTDSQPCECPCIFCRMFSGKSFNSCIGRRRPALQELLRHGFQRRRSHKCLVHPVEAR